MYDRIVRTTLDEAESALDLYGDKRISADVLLIDLRKKSRDLRVFDTDIADGLKRFADAVQAAARHGDAWVRIVDVRKRYREWRRVLDRKAAGVTTTAEMVALAERGPDKRAEPAEAPSARADRHAAMLAAAERVKAEAEARVADSVAAAMEASRQAALAAQAEIARATARRGEAVDLVRAAEDAVHERRAAGTVSAEVAEEPVDAVFEGDYATAIAEVEALLSGALDDTPPADKPKKL